MPPLSDSVTMIHKRAGEEILRQRGVVADALVTREASYYSGLEQRHGHIARDEALQAADFDLAYLASAVALESPILFTDYLRWSKTIWTRQDAASDLTFHLKCMAEVLGRILPPELGEPAVRIMQQGQLRLADSPAEIPSFIQPDNLHSLLAQEYLRFLLAGKRHAASALIQEAVHCGVSIQDLYLNVFQRTQYEIGRLWQMNQISVAQEHYCSAATQLIMSQLYPHIFRGSKTGGVFVGTCAGGELHEIGGRMIADFLEMAGWNSFYLGANISAGLLVQTLLERKASMLGISVTLTPNMRALDELIHEVRAEPACAGVKIIVGGYPFTIDPGLWLALGADGTARDAADVVALAGSLVA